MIIILQIPDKQDSFLAQYLLALHLLAFFAIFLGNTFT